MSVVVVVQLFSKRDARLRLELYLQPPSDPA